MFESQLRNLRRMQNNAIGIFEKTRMRLQKVNEQLVSLVDMIEGEMFRLDNQQAEAIQMIEKNSKVINKISEIIGDE